MKERKEQRHNYGVGRRRNELKGKQNTEEES
jgi:hypothetical protein